MAAKGCQKPGVARGTKLIIVDIIVEFFSWLFDRKNYKRNAVKSLKITGAIFGIALLVAVVLFLVLSIIYLRQQS